MKFILYFILLRWFLRIVLCAQQDPIERLFVSIEGDFSNLLDAADEGVDKTKDKLEELDDAGKKTGQGIKGSAAIAGAAFGLAAGAAGKLLDIVVNLAVQIPTFFINMGQAAVQANAQFETFATQFETLLGSGSAAQERLEELAQFGVETPFELPEIVEASRTLQTFGGTVLATGDNLRMIGDIAAGVNQPFQSVAFWIGRMFDAMQNGQPFGEASARLQEMGALTGDTRRQLEQMQKAGKDGAEIFAVFSDEVGGRFAGNMERLSGTFQGVMSNLEDFRGNLLRVGGEPFFDEVRQSALEFLDLLTENEGTITDIAVGIGELAAGIVRFVREGLGGFNIKGILDQIKAFVDWLNRTSRAFQAIIAVGGQFFEAISPLTDILKAIVAVGLSPFIKGLQALGEILSRVDEALITGAQILAFSAAGWKGLFAALAPIGNLISKTAQAMVALIQGDFKKAGQLGAESLAGLKDGLIDVDGGIKAMEDSIKSSAAAIEKWTSPAEKIKEIGEDVSDIEKPEDIGLPGPDKVQEMADGLTNQLIDATENRNEQLAALEESHAQKVVDIMADANDKRLSIEDKFADDMADLAEDSEDKRLEVIENTRRELAELAEQTDRQLAQRRTEFNRDELRETENHLREMRRLQEDFLFDLEGAVRARDAGAIVDLQRQFKKESDRREEDFQTGQNRKEEDFDNELAAIRDNESRRRQELLTAQEQAIADINQHEEEKRLDLEIRRQEDLDRLQENLQERLNRENESFMQRQAALDEALQAQLAAIAKNLADEKEVTAEGAQAILETFNEYFGIGGNIDQLMDDFSRRRKIRADIQVTFDTPGETKTTSQGSPGGGLGDRIGGPSEFAQGGTLIADTPTLALFGEAGPEIVQFTPMNQVQGGGGSGDGQRMTIEMTGSAPPGIGAGERDAIASVLVDALRETGALG